MKKLKLFFALFAMLALGVTNAWGAEKTITLTYSDFGLTTSYAQKTATVDGIEFTVNQGYKGSGNVIQMNSSKGAGVLYNTTSIAGLKSITVNVSSGSKTYTITSGTAQTPSGNSQTGTATKTFSIPSGDTYFQLKVSGASYFSSIVITYDDSNAGGETPGTGGETPEPEPDPTPDPGTGGTGTINFNSSAVKINATSVTGNDDLGNTWTITTVGTTSYTANNAYYQVGSGSKPATSITFTTTLPSDVNVTAFSAKFGGFNGTAGAVTLKVDDTSVGTGSLNATNDVTISNSSQATGKKLTVTLTGIAKGVKVYYISYTYTTSSGGSEPETPATELIDDQFAWSAATAEATMGASNTFPTLTNTLPVSVTYESSNTAAATIAADGTITLVAPGTTTISAAFAGGEVSGTKYAAKTVTYTLTVKQLVSCADIYDLADDATFVLKEFVVTYVNGKYTYIKDDTGYGLIFNNAGDYGLKAGDKVASGKFEGEKTTYKTLVEIIPVTAYDNLNATSGEAPDPEVMNTNPTEDDMNKYAKFEDVTFASTGFSDKKVTGTINAGDITFYDQFATSATFNTGKKYDVIGAVSIYNSTVQVNFISAEEVAEPTLNVEITNADFGKIAINGEAERTLTLNGSLLTKPVSLAIEGEGAEHFTLASNSVTPTDGNITDAKIKITYKPIAEGPHTATLKITSDELTEQTITLTGNAVEEYTVHFYVNGKEQTELAKNILSGNTLDALPEEPESCDPLTYPTFAGWTNAEIVGTTDTKPTMLNLSTPITSDCNYYAVFEKATVSGSSEEQTETITISNFKSSGDGEKRTCETNSATWTWLKNNASSTINVTYEEIRLYQYHSMTISQKDGCDISKIVVDINTGKPASDFAGNLTGATMSLNENTATLTPTSEDIVIKQLAQSRVNSFVVTYTTSTTTYEYITSCAVVVPTCEITYDYADGEGECTTDIVEKDTEYTLCATAPTKAGHTFLNWKDQNGVEYAKGATINSVTEDLTLTAQWQVNSYEVTWMSLGEEVTSNSANHNTQPTKPANPTYTCGTGKEFVGWTTQEIDGVGVPANLYTDDFPVVTEAITYYAVFAGKSTEATTTTSTLLVTEKLGNYASGSMKDDQENVWNYYAGGYEDAGTYYLALRNNNDEISYIESPKFAGTIQSIVAYVRNGSSSKERTVYLRSSAVVKPTEGDLGATSIPASNNSEVNLDFTSSFDKFYIQVSEGLQFHKIVVTSGVAVGDYIDYTTSCPTPEVIRDGLTVGQWGTLCPKQNVDNPTGATFYQIAYLELKDGLPFNMHFDEVEGNLEAGQPYFFIASATQIKGVKSGEEKNEGSNVNGFYGYIGETSWTLPYQASFDVNNNNTFVIWNNSVFRINAETSIKSERCYININSTEPIRTSTPAPVGARRITMGVSGINGQNTATGVDQVQGDNVPTKMIINGQLFILRGEKMYDAQGKLVK